MKDFNDEFSTRHTELSYNKFTDHALNEAKELQNFIITKKKLTSGQIQEMENLSEQLKISLNKRLNILIDQAKELTVKQELQKIREKKLLMDDATDRIQLTPKKSLPKLLFTNTKGQIVSMEAIMKLTVGDQLWSSVTAAQRSEWILLGFRYVLHISVLDEKTTQICIKLDHTERDLLSDQLPPMHFFCRSKVKLVKDKWDSKVFLKNFSENSLNI